MNNFPAKTFTSHLETSKEKVSIEAAATWKIFFHLRDFFFLQQHFLSFMTHSVQKNGSFVNPQAKGIKIRTNFLPAWVLIKKTEAFAVTTLQIMQSRIFLRFNTTKRRIKRKKELKSYFNCLLLFKTKGGFAAFSTRSFHPATWMNKLNTWARWWHYQTCANVSFAEPWVYVMKTH